MEVEFENMIGLDVRVGHFCLGSPIASASLPWSLELGDWSSCISSPDQANFAPLLFHLCAQKPSPQDQRVFQYNGSRVDSVVRCAVQPHYSTYVMVVVVVVHGVA